MQSLKYEAIKISMSSKSQIKDSVVIEAPLQININEEPYTVVMRTPGNDKELIRGLLYAEDIYKGEELLNTLLIETTDTHFSIFNVIIPNSELGKGYMNKRSLLSVSSCGICGKQSIDDIKVIGTKLELNRKIDFSKIKDMFYQMQKRQILFSNTGASHAAAIFNSDYSLLSIMEDIGRHNAVDKAIGELINNNQLKNSSYLLVSGRVSYEIVTKAFIAKIKTIIAVSGCSSLAIDFAKEFGIQLLGFTRDERTTIYS
jgi:FdhD protein